MRKWAICCILLVLLLAVNSSIAAGAWADRFPKPQVIIPGFDHFPGQMLASLTPELKYQAVGAINYLEIFDAQDSKLTLSELLSEHRTPVLSAQVHSTSLLIPAGILLPGKTYYWRVISIHAPGSKSEATTFSQSLYFSTPIVNR